MFSFCELTSFYLLVFLLFILIYELNEAEGIKADMKLANDDNHHENISDPGFNTKSRQNNISI